MDVLSLNTVEKEADFFSIRWKWRQGEAKQPGKGGTIQLRLARHFLQDRPILAELAALYHLLETYKIHGERRLGNGLIIQVSFGAIRKAVLKGSLKQSGRGDTDKTHVAAFAKFLATKYFEAEVEVLKKWQEETPKVQMDFDLVVSQIPLARVASPIGPVVVSRHALNRIVGRCISREELKAQGKNENDLKDLPNCRWSAAWRYLERALVDSELGKVVASEHKRVLRKYGKNPFYLYHRGSNLVHVVVRESYGLELVTAIHGRYWAAKNIPTQVGQKIVYGYKSLHAFA
jgi:hypothetical protein